MSAYTFGVVMGTAIVHSTTVPLIGAVPGRPSMAGSTLVHGLPLTTSIGRSRPNRRSRRRQSAPAVWDVVCQIPRWHVENSRHQSASSVEPDRMLPERAQRPQFGNGPSRTGG